MARVHLFSKMLLIARRNLFGEKVRLLIAVGGVGFAVLLILVLAALYTGWRDRMGRYVSSVPADLWVVQEGLSDMFHSLSLLPAEARGGVEAVEGVARVHPLLGRQVTFTLRGQDAHLFLIGYHTQEGMGGPVEMARGRPPRGPGELVVDQVFAREKSVDLGDRITIQGHDLQVVGLSRGGNLVIYQYAFVTAEDAVRVLRLDGLVNFLLVRAQEGQDPDALARRIEREAAGVKAVDPPTFRRMNSKMIDEAFLPILAVLMAIGLAVGTAVVGLTIYTSTLEKSREFGVLKAIGAAQGHLVRLVLLQSLLVTLVGYGVGLLGALAVTRVAQRLVAQFVTSWSPAMPLGALGASLVMSVLAAYLPVRRLGRIDPAEVFRA